MYFTTITIMIIIIITITTTIFLCPWPWSLDPCFHRVIVCLLLLA
jgi:hypothetical protein